MSVRTWTRAAAASVIGAGTCVLTALPAQAQAEVVRPPVCGYFAEVPGGETVPGTGITDPVSGSYCLAVFTPSGGFHYVIRAEAPEGYAIDRALVHKGEGDRTVVTPSGRITGTGSFR